MKSINNYGALVLGIWLILSGLMSFGIGFSDEGTLLALLAIIAGILILLGR